MLPIQAQPDHPADPTTPFSPSPDQTDQILHALGDPARSLLGIAEEHGVSLPQLTLWLARPDVAARLDALEHAVARRTRLLAASYLPTVAQAVARTIDAAESDAQEAATITDRRRAQTLILRAAALLHKLSHHTPRPTPKPTPPPPTHPLTSPPAHPPSATPSQPIAHCPLPIASPPSLTLPLSPTTYVHGRQR